MQFRDVHAALAWAYLAEVCPVDQREQAAQLRALVQRLDPPVRRLAIVMYSHGPQRYPAQVALINSLNPLPHQRAAFELMLLQFVSGERRRGVAAVRRLLRCGTTRAAAERARVFATLDALRLELFAAIEPRLVEAKLLRAPAACYDFLEDVKWPRSSSARDEFPRWPASG